MTKHFLYDIGAETTAVEKGVVVNAMERITDDCRLGTARFLKK